MSLIIFSYVENEKQEMLKSLLLQVKKKLKMEMVFQTKNKRLL